MPPPESNPLTPEKQARLKALRSKLDRLMSETRTPAPLPTPTAPSPSPGSQAPLAAPSPLLYRRDLPRATPHRSRPSSAPETPVALEEAVVGAEWIHPQRGPLFGVDTPVTAIPDAETVTPRLNRALLTPHAHLATRLACLEDCGDLKPPDLIFMDIESTGLSCSPLFLIGVLIWQNDAWVVKQYFARNYAEEPAALAFFADVCQNRRLLVTFNGKSYDIPYIRSRCAATGVPPPTPLAHFDLLHESRRVWKTQLPNCKLQTLETFICGRRRHGDIPGDQIPDAYHSYVHSDNAWQMVDVLQHNMLDLVTLADLIPRLGAQEP